MKATVRVVSDGRVLVRLDRNHGIVELSSREDLAGLRAGDRVQVERRTNDPYVHLVAKPV